MATKGGNNKAKGNGKAAVKASAKATPAAKGKASAKATPLGTGAETYEPNKDRRVLQQLVGKFGAVSAGYQAAFDGLASDARREQLGTRTRALGVFRDAVAWAVSIGHAFTNLPAALEGHYAKERFQYYLHRVGLLDAAIQAQEAARGGQGTVRDTAAEREAAARKARSTLIDKLTGFAGARESEKAALDAAVGTTDSTTALGKSIQALATLGKEWLGRSDEASKLLAKSAGLGASVVQAALDAGEALTGAATTATLAGRKAATDSAAVNVAEGAVLFEMAEAMRCFNAAHEDATVVPKLVAGAATRHVLGPKVRSAPAAATGAAGTGAAGARRGRRQGRGRPAARRRAGAPSGSRRAVRQARRAVRQARRAVRQARRAVRQEAGGAATGRPRGVRAGAAGVTGGIGVT